MLYLNGFEPVVRRVTRVEGVVALRLLYHMVFEKRVVPAQVFFYLLGNYIYFGNHKHLRQKDGEKSRFAKLDTKRCPSTGTVTDTHHLDPI